MTWEGKTKTLIYEGAYATYPTWSADGSTIVFQQYMGPSGSGLYRIPAIGGSVSLVTPTADVGSINPDWSPSTTPNGNEMIAYSDAYPNEYFNLFVVRPDGTGKLALTSDTYNQFSATWNYLGDKIAVSRADSTGQNHRIVVYDIAVDGNGDLYIALEQDITAVPPLSEMDYIGTPSFARTSNDLLVYVSNNNIKDIWLIPDADPSNPAIQLTDSANDGGYARHPAWKSDDSMFVHEGPKPKGNGEVAWVRDADGSNPIAIDPKRTASNFGTRP
jgi:Tol biopolymer transport system component